MAITMVCGLVPSLQLVVKAEEKVPIIIIPGIMGSKLYSDKECEDTVWGDEWAVILATIKKTGEKLAIGNQLYAKGLTLAEEEEYGTIDAYKDLMTLLEGEYPDRDVYLFSYDWRQSNVDSAIALKDELAERGIQKADFLCHSMGGLVMSQYINAEGTDAIKHVITLGSPLEGASKCLQAILTKNILTGDLAIGNDLMYKSGLTPQLKAGLLGVGELAPTIEYWNGRVNGVVEGVSVGSGVQARRMYTYDDVLRCIFGEKYEQVIAAQESCQAGVDKLLSMENAYFAIGYNQRTMSGVRILINTDKPAGSFESVVFYDCEYETMGDNTVPFHSANMMHPSYPENASYFKLGHDEISGNKATEEKWKSEWEKEKAWLFSILNDEEVKSNASEITPNAKPFTVVRVNAPMGAEVSYNGETLSSEDYCDETTFGMMNLMGIDNEIKMFCVDSGNDYKVTMSGLSDGVLEYAIRFYDGNGEMYEERMVNDVTVTSKTVIKTGTDENKDTVLEIDVDGNGSIDNTVTIEKKEDVEEPEKEPSDDPIDKPEHTHVYKKPVFNWNKNCKAATATFTCKDNDLTQEIAAKVTEKVVEPTTSKKGKVTYTASVEFEGKTYKDTKTVVIPKKIKINSVVNQNGSVKLTWTKCAEASGYKVYRKAKGQDKYYLLKTIKNNTVTSYTDKTEKSIVNGRKSQYYISPYYADASVKVYKSSEKMNYYLKRGEVVSVNTNGSKKLKVSWKKNDNATGYQVRYSTDKSFAKYNGEKINSKKVVTKTFGSLKKNKNYYVKVRAYKTVNGKTYYSAWSTVKSKKTK